MSGSITGRHLQIEVFKNPTEVRVCGDKNLYDLFRNYFNSTGNHFNKFVINIDDTIGVITNGDPCEVVTREISIKLLSGRIRSAELLKMAIVRALENEAFKIISVVFDQASGTEKLMMHKEA